MTNRETITPATMSTVILAMCVVSASSAFARDPSLDSASVLAWGYYVVSRLKFYLDDREYYRRVTDGLYKNISDRWHATEFLIGTLSWVIWVGVAPFVAEHGSYLLFRRLTVFNLLLSTVWILVSASRVSREKDNEAPKVRRMHWQWAIANIFQIAILWPNGFEPWQQIGLSFAVVLVDAGLGWRFALGLPSAPAQGPRTEEHPNPNQVL